FGVALVNLAPRRSQQAFGIVEHFAAPIYVLFFVIAGARMHIGGMEGWMWWLALPYTLGRIAAKVGGSYLGARWAGAGSTVRRYLGLCMFCQGGVAIGLSILASVRFAEVGPIGVKIGDAILLIVAATTFVVELIGPPAVKIALKKAGEIGLDVTEEDLINAYHVRDMVDRDAPVFAEGAMLGTILRTVSETAATAYPVADSNGRLVGVITLEELKSSFGSEELTDWLVAIDVMQPAADVIAEGAPLSEAVTRMREQHLEYLPVVTGEDNASLVGMLELRAVQRSLSGEVLRRHRQADGG
ncbi:hypothetical protein LCGC14_1938670, partial [marine sediment metagenome]